MCQNLKKMYFTKIMVVFLSSIIVLLSGCATSPDSIGSTYVPNFYYDDYTCEELKDEVLRITGEINTLSSSQKRKRTTDAVAIGTSLVLFWPAAFFLFTSDKKDRISKAKGHYEAIERLARKKKCSYSKELRVMNNI